MSAQEGLAVLCLKCASHGGQIWGQSEIAVIADPYKIWNFDACSEQVCGPQRWYQQSRRPCQRWVGQAYAWQPKDRRATDQELRICKV